MEKKEWNNPVLQIRPREDDETGGIALMPMKKNIPKAKNPQWKLIKCPGCGRECWHRGEFEEYIENHGMRELCTECGLKAMK